ncbi:hypothetical protein DACRYDRAFT_25449 [Dacryopinax primogenitus]|uniref:Uncharacterized protein n=1 Tax=Dacryopinax primogenitus (strain DJM 731) TaxID=1858805 RepID=M5FZV5_DACPD|nr:uncharacterized protein DACRYDRAFT_25449 [Dacryopinax primogenitus]EJT97042.1 hypothetical protein DACRYDRAFT_25449 [Dacryopinax primogenitus]
MICALYLVKQLVKQAHGTLRPTNIIGVWREEIYVDPMRPERRGGTDLIGHSS